MSIRDFIERAWKAQQSHEQYYDVQLSFPETLWASEEEKIQHFEDEIAEEWNQWWVDLDKSA
jgi:hypothetical protein